MLGTKTQPRRLRVRPTEDGKAVICPMCPNTRRMSLGLLLDSHLNDHHYGLFGAERTGQIKVEVTLLVEEAP